MPTHCETRILPYTPAQLFGLVADVSRYPEFLPWCHAARVYDVTEAGFMADLTVGPRAFVEVFTSQVLLSPHKAITVAYKGGPLSRLENRWTFAPVAACEGDEEGCAVEFYVDFAFRSPLLSALMDGFFDSAFRRMVSAFEARAAALYP